MKKLTNRTYFLYFAILFLFFYTNSLKKCDRELLYLRNTEGDKPRVLKLTADTVKNNRRFTIE